MHVTPQHGSPVEPQGAQTPDWQLVPAVVQAGPVAQQGPPGPPHTPPSTAASGDASCCIVPSCAASNAAAPSPPSSPWTTETPPVPPESSESVASGAGLRPESLVAAASAPSSVASCASGPASSGTDASLLPSGSDDWTGNWQPHPTRLLATIAASLREPIFERRVTTVHRRKSPIVSEPMVTPSCSCHRPLQGSCLAQMRAPGRAGRHATRKAFAGAQSSAPAYAMGDSRSASPPQDAPR